jgi:hypothetical protein
MPHCCSVETRGRAAADNARAMQRDRFQAPFAIGPRLVQTLRGRSRLAAPGRPGVVQQAAPATQLAPRARWRYPASAESSGRYRRSATKHSQATTQSSDARCSLARKGAAIASRARPLRWATRNRRPELGADISFRYRRRRSRLAHRRRCGIERLNAWLSAAPPTEALCWPRRLGRRKLPCVLFAEWR